MTKKAQDVTTDSAHTVLYKIAQTLDFNLPKYVEEGVPLEKEAAAKTDGALFADTRNRRFPITDRANTWLSGAYFAKTASTAYSPEEYRTIAGRILKAAELYGVDQDVADVMGTLTEQTLAEAHVHAEKEAAAAEACYGEPETEGFPMFSPEQVKMACTYFDDNAYSYDWQRRANIARNIMRKAAEYGLVPTETVRKEAGAGFPRRDYLAENLLTRETELDRRGLHKLAGDMRRTIKIILESPAEDLMGQLEPLREMISGADELSGIDNEYGVRFNPPADFLFDIDDGAARRFQEDTIPIGHELLSAQALSGLPRMLFDKVLGRSAVDGMMDGGKLSPKKISITIVKMAPRDQTSLLDVLRDYTANPGMVYNDVGDTDDTEDAEDACENACGENCKNKQEKEDDD